MQQPGADVESVLARVRQLVEIESPSGDVAASRRMAQVLGDWLAATGAEVRTHDTDLGRSVVAELPGRGEAAPPLLLVGHSDTVWPAGTLDGVVPWVRDGDVVRGPGVLDMKSGLVTMVAALEAVSGGDHVPVRVVVVCDEEVGSPSTRDLLAECATGVRGAVGFECPHPDGALKVGRRGSTRVRLEVTGREAHAALDPEKGISAVDELLDQLLAVRDIVATAADRAPVLYNVGIVEGGTRANVVAAHACAELGLRFVDPESERAVLSALSGLQPVRAGAVLEVSTLSHRPAWVASAGDERLLDLVRAAGADLGQSVEGRPAAGAGDANLIGAGGVATVDGFGPRGGGAHARDEHLLVGSLMERIALLTALLRRDG